MKTPLLLLALLSAACARHAPPAAPVDMRAQIDTAMRREVEPLRGRDDVAAYLERLRARAVAQRRVTALEIETGVAAIESLMAELGGAATQDWVARFVQSMTELSAGYRRPQPQTTTH